MMKWLSFSLAFAALAACSGAPQSVPSVMTLEASEWGAGVDGQYIQFREGTAKGNGGCNQFSGTYTQDAAGLRIGPLMATEMACDNLSDETVFFQILSDTRSADISHLELVLKDTAGEPLLTLQRRDWD